MREDLGQSFFQTEDVLYLAVKNGDYLTAEDHTIEKDNGCFFSCSHAPIWVR